MFRACVARAEDLASIPSMLGGSELWGKRTHTGTLDRF